MRDGYSITQILLHWVIACLIPVQYLTGGSIERTHHAVHMGNAPDPWDVLQHKVHIYAGIAIGLLMGIRLLVKLLFGSPTASAKGKLERAAYILYFGFYLVIIFQAVLGFVASYLWFGVAPYHVIGSWIILAMVFMHLSAAAWHTLVMKDNTLDKIVLPRSKNAGF